jgi:hypothetical protein
VIEGGRVHTALPDIAGLSLGSWQDEDHILGTYLLHEGPGPVTRITVRCRISDSHCEKVPPLPADGVSTELRW